MVVQTQDTKASVVSRFRYTLGDGSVEHVVIADDLVALPLRRWSQSDVGSAWLSEAALARKAKLPGDEALQQELTAVLHDAIERHWSAVAARP